MNNKEILKKYTNEFKNKYDFVIIPDEFYSKISFGLAKQPISERKSKQKKVPENHDKIKHFMIATKPYRDESCAVFKLCSYLENHKGSGKNLFLRASPTVENEIFFHSSIKYYRGYCRFTEENK